MARTKSSSIVSKFLKAEHLRLRSSRQDPKFQADLKRLEDAAKSLPHISPMPVSEFNERNHRLPTHSEEKLIGRWKDSANDFLNRWGFTPYPTKNNGVKLFIRSSVSFGISPDTGNVTEVKLNIGRYPLGDSVALAKHYQGLRSAGKPRSHQNRLHLDITELKIKARQFTEEGFTHKEIAEVLYPREYRKALSIDPKIREQFGELAQKYRCQPYDLAGTEAERKAASELGLDVRPESVKLKKLSERVRYLLRSRQQASFQK